MTDWLYAAVPQYGVAILFAVNLMSCLGVPIPASLVMIAAGAFVAVGDLAALAVLVAAFAGAVAGDQTGYVLGLRGGAPLWNRLAARPRSAALMRRAADSLNARAAKAVLLSRWPFSALAPWVNLAAGATGVAWRRFTRAAVAGRAVWVGLYLGLGFVFADRAAEIGQTMVTVIGALCAGAVAVLLGRTLWRMRREEAD